jgi:hypothetical protein
MIFNFTIKTYIMRKKNILNSVLVVLSFLFFLFSCGDKPTEESLAKKRIFQKIDAAALFTIKDLEIVSVEKKNDTTYKAVHIFTNPILNREMRITRNYFFTLNTDSIKGQEDLNIEMKSKGEWVKAKF